MTATLPTLPSQYNPAETESKWQAFWDEHQVFKADPNAPGEPYCVVIPPPNVTGSLHMGHAFENALIDTLVRYHRMIGRNTLWLPGTDHASIAVQTILERELRSQGKTRADVGREAFLKRAWEWKEESGSTIVNQLRRLGVSADWSRERFTMDEGLSDAVLYAFNQLYEEELIYRGNYMVNWCPATQSAVSDLEVENTEVNGNLWHFRYPLTDGSGFVEVATTRPETMLGDTAVAVNPDDERYKDLVGKTLMLPIMQREIPIIADEYVDASFGTGCVKVTPAHDPNDFEMGKRHDLPMINILNKDGTLNENVAAEFQGLDRFVARKKVVERLEADGFLVRVEDYKHTVPYSDRGKVPVEPLLSTQWFVKIRPLADNALNFLDNQNDPIFVPERWTKVYRDWLVSLRDWCISRQLWWGHQIPAWYAVSETGGEITDNTPFVVAMSEAEARTRLEAKFGSSVEIQQDPDVLDTWFSSGLWPFSTMGWPNDTPDLARYYPTTTLVTGFDIIFFWVARMTMMAGHFTGKMPFKTVYIHGLVRDENNKKMSKSANNGIDPLLLINKYGTDALRYTLIREVAGAGQDIRLAYNRKTDESESVEASRNFTNKLWNASRFVLMNLDGKTPEQLGEPALEDLELADRWILSRYHQVVQQTRTYTDNFGLGEAAKGLYEFIWGDFCDWYIELAKSRLQQKEDPSRLIAQQTLAYVLEGTLRLLHPFMPHITEEVWQTLTQSESKRVLALQAYPEANATFINPELETQFDLVIGTIRTIRNLRAEADVKPGAKVKTILRSEDLKERLILSAAQFYIKDLAKVGELIVEEPELPASEAGAIASTPSTPSLDVSSLTNWTDRISWDTLKSFRKPLLSLGLLYLLLLGLRIGINVFQAIDSIAILRPFFKLVGLGYAGWFTLRYLVISEGRQELLDTMEGWIKEPKSVASLPATETPPAPLPAKVEVVPEVAPEPETEQMLVGVVGTVQVLLPLAGVVDLVALRSKLERDLAKVEGEAKSLSDRLSNQNFVARAPEDVVQTARDALAEAQKQAEILRDRLQQLQ
ncbi:MULTISPECIES: valine--tRNA ligase [unclassified Leptolyngbya]|uniref:valine--tRNA ligase n=1 Tax=unclassified Leptolyngbya TaxID=2650499 RepID=UPI001684D24C|nr:MULTISPECIES: valine--tRNA ligase [unclassified Leptolyngbya]MBD1912274.1 valine--tRNA ligase [Leptolyngbya sp. FACHB-8]MBD2153843.1 valine--tRNA ligase [Leptolyngbya sp. FACHB-16]